MTKGLVRLTKDTQDIGFCGRFVTVSIPLDNINYIEHGSGIATLIRLKKGEDFWVKEKPKVVEALIEKASKP